MKKGTYSKVAASHEVRMWLGQIIVPVCLLYKLGWLPNIHIRQHLKKAGEKIKSIFQKKK